MYVCQWQFDIPFGKQKDVLDILRAWNQDMFRDPEIPKPKSQRLMVGHIGVSASHIIEETVCASMSEFETIQKVVATGRFHKHSEAIAPYIVPGSQHWVILKVVE
jgi:hypothetical protein